MDGITSEFDKLTETAYQILETRLEIRNAVKKKISWWNDMRDFLQGDRNLQVEFC